MADLDIGSIFNKILNKIKYTRRFVQNILCRITKKNKTKNYARLYPA